MNLMSNSSNDKMIVAAFVAHLSAIGNPDLKIDHIPDDENCSSLDIDAIVGIFAIEHSSIDTIPTSEETPTGL